MTGAGLRQGVPQAPRFCASPPCSIVYFDEVSARRVEERELTVLVYAKHPQQLTAPVCYCFGYTLGMVKDARVEQKLSSHMWCAQKSKQGTARAK